jgi:hypothetical protein
MNNFSLQLSGLAGLVLALAGMREAVAVEIADARPLLEAHCFDCHAGGAAEGNFALDDLLAADDSPATRQTWRKVWKMVRQEFMPPAEAEPLAAADRKAITRWVEHQPLGIDFDRPDPGRVTMRRLNRVEYEYTVNDLFGVTVTASENLASLSQGREAALRELLPPDDTAYGFDNIGDFQTLSPALLEKYFEIAELVVSRVIVTAGPWYPVQELDRSRLRVERDRETKVTRHEARFDITEPGEYRVAVSFYLGGWQEYGGGFEYSFGLDGAPVAAEHIDVGGQQNHAYVREGQLEAGAHAVTLVTKAVTPDSEGQLVNLQLNPKITVTGPIAADRRSYPESHQRIFFNGEPPADAAARRQYAKDILARVASRAFRRPVDDATLERLTNLAMAGDSFERGIGDGLLAILTSPRFLFRTELQPQPDDPTVRHAIDDYALASRLSYLLWLSLPDDELTRLAAAGTLREHLRGQVARMLADPKSGRFFEDFAGQWLRTRNVLMTPISRRDDIDPFRGAMKRETELLFEHIARNDRDLIELVTADYTFLNGQLARFYGIPGVGGDEFRQVELPPETHRGGLLTQGSFLVSTSNPDRTSPVKRGLFVLENLLATQPPPPPANVPPLEDANTENGFRATVREQLEAHRADPACAACHAHFDPIGIVLENYDLIGRWRDAERGGGAIDPSATTVTGESLAGIDDLRRYIAGNRERFYRCVIEKLMTYALGRGLEPYDAVTVDDIADSLLADNGKFSTALTKVVESPAFQLRRGDDDSELDAAALTKIPDIPPPDKRRPDPRRFRRFLEFNQQQQFEGRRGRRDRDDESRPRPAERAQEPEAEAAEAREAAAKEPEAAAPELEATAADESKED